MLNNMFRQIYFPKIIKSSKLGDAAVLKQIIKILKAEKIETLSSNKFTPELSMSKGIYTKIKPNIDDKKDINCAINAVNRSGNFSHTQGAIARNNKIIGVEGKSGTQKMLEKIYKSSNKLKGVLVKFPKKKQDVRIDLPTVGIDTLKQSKKAGLKGLVLKHKRNIFLDKSQSINFANKNKMFIIVK